MASKPEQEVKAFVNSVQKRLSMAINSRQMGVIGRFVVELIKERSRRGYGVAKNGNPEKSFPKPLSKGYVAQRRRSRLSPFTTPTKSNITRTGKLLASIRYTVNTGRAVVRPVGSRNDSNLSNAELASELQGRLNRPFMYLSAKQINALRRFIETDILGLK
jgi:hypothetical protein